MGKYLHQRALSDFMEQETEVKTDEYYILFREMDNPTPTVRVAAGISPKRGFWEKMVNLPRCLIDKLKYQLAIIDKLANPDESEYRKKACLDKIYKERCEQNDLLITDKASYVWCYAGELTRSQAKIVKNSLYSEVDKGFWLERMSSAESLNRKDEIEFVCYPRGTISVTPHEPASLDFLVRISPNLAFFSHMPLNHCVRIFPDSAKEKRKIIHALNPSAQKRFGFTVQFDPKKCESPKRHRSFVELISLSDLMDMWQRVGHYHKDLLRCTAGIWVVVRLENRQICTPGEILNLERTATNFRSRVLGKKNIWTLTQSQKCVLKQCIDIVNKIRSDHGSKGRNICNQYEHEKHVRKPSKRAKKAMRWVEVDDYYLLEMRGIPIRKDLRMKPGIVSISVSVKNEKSDQDVLPTVLDGQFTEEPEVPTNEPGGTPYIFAARKKTKKESQSDGRTTFRATLEDEGDPTEWEPPTENVNVVNQLTKKDIADGAFDGTRRALARFINPKDETPIEKVHRLRCDDVEWKYIARTIYKEENGKNIAESDLDSEVKRLQKQHKREYPEFYEK